MGFMKKIKLFSCMLMTFILCLNMVSCGKTTEVTFIYLDDTLSKEDENWTRDEIQKSIKFSMDYLGLKELNSDCMNVNIRKDGVCFSGGSSITLTGRLIKNKCVPIAHEINHSVVSLNPKPSVNNRFFLEGFANFIQNLYYDENKVPIDNRPVFTLLEYGIHKLNKYTPLKNLIDDDSIYIRYISKTEDEELHKKVMDAYTEAGAFFKFLDSKYGKEKIKELYSSDKVLDFKGVYGKDIEKLEGEFKDYYNLK